MHTHNSTTVDVYSRARREERRKEVTGALIDLLGQVLCREGERGEERGTKTNPPLFVMERKK
jgi:hypothetical protein